MPTSLSNSFIQSGDYTVAVAQTRLPVGQMVSYSPVLFPPREPRIFFSFWRESILRGWITSQSWQSYFCFTVFGEGKIQWQFQPLRCQGNVVRRRTFQKIKFLLDQKPLDKKRKPVFTRAAPRPLSFLMMPCEAQCTEHQEIPLGLTQELRELQRNQPNALALTSH